MDRVKPTWFRVLAFPVTVVVFWKFFRTLETEPHPWRAAFGYAKLTVRRRS